MKLMLAGWQASRRKRELEVIHRGKMENRCFSFANLVKIGKFPYFIKGFQGSYEACVENKIGIMYDSGVVSYRGYLKVCARQGKDLSQLPDEEEFARLYVEHVKANKQHWDFYVTLDMIPKADNVLLWLNKLEKMGIRPTPVFHGDTTVDWLKRYADKGYKFVCLGGSYQARSTNKRVMRQYLDGVFNMGEKLGMSYHGLAMTSPWLMLSYPFRSVDSSWWTRTAGYGSIMRFDDVTERMSILHVSRRDSNAKGQELKQNARAMSMLKSELKEEGFDLELLRDDFTERHVYNALTMKKLCDAATKRHKGTWDVIG